MARATTSQTPRRLRRLEFTVIGAIALFVLALAAASLAAGIDQVWAHLKKTPVTLIATMLALSAVNYGLRAWRWHWFSRGLGMTVPFGRNLLYFIAGFALSTTPGKTGEALRLWLIERCHGYGYQRTAPMFVGDRLSDMGAILLLCLGGASAFSGYTGIVAAAAGALVLASIPFLRPALPMWLVRASHALLRGRWPRLFAGLRIALRETARLFTLRLFGLGLLAALIGWCAEVWAFSLLLQALGTEVSLRQASFIFTFAMIAGTVSMLPGGLGGTEAAMIGLLSAVGVGFDTALVATAIVRLTTLWFATGLGFIALAWAMRLARTGG